jgi:hypothetical protein
MGSLTFRCRAYRYSPGLPSCKHPQVLAGSSSVTPFRTSHTTVRGHPAADSQDIDSQSLFVNTISSSAWHLTSYPQMRTPRTTLLWTPSGTSRTLFRELLFQGLHRRQYGDDLPGLSGQHFSESFMGTLDDDTRVSSIAMKMRLYGAV